jgi:hypothetical protein
MAGGLRYSRRQKRHRLQLIPRGKDAGHEAACERAQDRNGRKKA